MQTHLIEGMENPEGSQETQKLHQLIAKETPEIVNYLRSIAKRFNHIGDFFDESGKTNRLFFTDDPSIETFTTIFDDPVLLTLFSTKYKDFPTELSLDSIDYFQIKIADYFFLPILEQQSWKEFWDGKGHQIGQVELMKLHIRISKEGYILTVLNKIRSAFIFKLAMNWSTKIKTPESDEKSYHNKFIILQKITNAAHMEAEEIIKEHEITQEKKFNSGFDDFLDQFLSYKSGLNDFLKNFLTHQKTSKRSQHLNNLAVTISTYINDIQFSCLTNHGQIIISWLINFFENIPEEKLKHRKEAAAIIWKIINDHRLKSDELLNMIEPYVIKKKDAKKGEGVSLIFDTKKNAAASSDRIRSPSSERGTTSTTSTTLQKPNPLLKFTSAPIILSNSNPKHAEPDEVPSTIKLTKIDSEDSSESIEEKPKNEKQQNKKKRIMLPRSHSASRQQANIGKISKEDGSEEIKHTQQVNRLHLTSTPIIKSKSTNEIKKSPASKPKNIFDETRSQFTSSTIIRENIDGGSIQPMDRETSSTANKLFDQSGGVFEPSKTNEKYLRTNPAVTHKT